MTAFEFGYHGVAMLKCNDTGALDELLPPKREGDRQADDKEAAR